MANCENFGHSQSPSAEHGLRSRRLRPCGALRGEGSGTETLRGTPENPSRMGTLACLRPEMDCPTHTTIWAQSQSADSRYTQNYSRQKRGLWKKGDLISRLISFARNFRPSMLICGKPKSEHGGLKSAYHKKNKLRMKLPRGVVYVVMSNSELSV